MLLFCTRCGNGKSEDGLTFEKYEDWLEHLASTKHRLAVLGTLRNWKAWENERSYLLEDTMGLTQMQVLKHFSRLGMVGDFFCVKNMSFCVLRVDSFDDRKVQLGKEKIGNITIRICDKKTITQADWNYLLRSNCSIAYPAVKHGVNAAARVNSAVPIEATDQELQVCGVQALGDFRSLMNDAATADVEIKATMGAPKSFYCHKSILIARSPTFRAMFETTMKEAKENVVEVEDVSAETMEYFISFLYCGRFQDSSWISKLLPLAYAADKYCVKSLKEFCDSSLIEMVTCKNALAVGSLAERHGLVKAVSDIRIFIAKNAENLTLDMSVATEGL